MNTNEKIEQLRSYMKERHIDVYYAPNEDDHLSEEYTAPYFQSKSFISGFSGESGCVIVTKDFAGLWTDGRYFTQAEKELAGSFVELKRMGQEGVEDPIDFLVEHTPENGTLGFDGTVVSAHISKVLENRLKKKGAKMHVHEDLIDLIWKDRPSMPKEKLFILPVEYAGKSISEKLAQVRDELQQKGADYLVITSIEDPCWLFNIRGNDIAHTPVSYAFALVGLKQATYYIDFDKLTPEVNQYFKDNQVSVKAYDALYEDLKQLHDQVLLCDMNKLNAYLYTALDTSNQIIDAPSPLLKKRAVKNEVEIRNTKHAHIKDGVAMVNFIYWLKQQDKVMSEVEIQDHLYALRQQGDLYIEPSFNTICAYGENAAMMHYAATPQSFANVERRGFLLVDSGGTYYDGTTDITRTIAVGALTEEEKRLYTLVLKGHLSLSNAKFLYGTSGNNLDILARRPLWDLHIDYQCGTGHGVGHVLSVHEGPHTIRPGFKKPPVALEEGMIVTNEPGVYMPGKLGIRIENELLVVKSEKNFYGQFLKFDTLTLCPYEVEALDLSLLNEQEKEWINTYHAFVYETLKPYLSTEVANWLKKVTERI